MMIIRSTSWLGMGSVNAKIANETNLCAEESWAVRTRNGDGSGWCGSAFSKFLAQLSCCIPSCFTDFHSMFENFTPLVFVLCQIFQAIRGDRKIWQRPSVCLWSAFSSLFGSACPETICCRAVSSEGGDLSCGQHDRPNKAVIASRWCRCWEEKSKLKLWCQRCVFAMWCHEPSLDRLCESGLASLALISRPCFTAIKEGGRNNSSVYLDFGCLQDATLIPHILVELAKGCTCFCESGAHLVIHDDILREGATEVGELFYHL